MWGKENSRQKVILMTQISNFERNRGQERASSCSQKEAQARTNLVRLR